MEQRATTISMSNITKRFGDIEAVTDVTMSAKVGEIIGFVGPNGAGKSTTLAILMGFLGATRGSVRILEKEVTPESAHKVHKHIGYVAGDMVLPSPLTGQQFVDFTAKQNGRDEVRYEKLLSSLSPVLNRPIKTLSRGNKQKVALVAALQHTPSILILDEPTSGLDPLMQDVFLAAIQTEAKRGATVIMSSHILSEVSSISSRIVFMKAGKFIVDQTIDDITNQLGKHIVITTTDVQKLRKYLPTGVSYISHTADKLRVALPSNHLKSFMQWLVTKNFSDVVIEDRDLDDVFHELYIEKVGK